MGSIEIVNLGGGSSSGGGDVEGPASSVANRIAAFDGTTGKLIKDSGVDVETGGTNSFRVGANSTLGTGVSNTAIGDGATTASGDTAQNTAVGKGASAIGIECLAVGEAAAASGLRSTAIGRNAIASGSEAMAIGRSTSATSGSCIAFGAGALSSSTSGGANFALGKNSSVTSANGNSVAIGNSTSITGSVGAVCVGDSSRCQGAVATALGRQSKGDHDYAICLGYLAASTTTNQMVIGNHSAQINFIEAGKGVTSSNPTEVVWRTTSGSGTDINGANFVCEPGRPTGSGSSGQFIVRTAAPGASGTTLRTSVDNFFVDTNGNIFCGPASAPATTDTQTFTYIRGCAGTPTGVPATSKTGHYALRIDVTNHKLYYYNGGWVDLTGT